MEILAPCGGPEHVTAAVNAGAHAVYLGAHKLSARRNAGNFTPEQLAEAVRFCHERNTRVYLTVNTIVFDEEADALTEILLSARELGIDALIIQDWGAAHYAKALLPDMPLYASTQCSVHTPQGALTARALGFSRVVLARELSREQISEIISVSGLETEVFVHGALCGGVSGQCYFSAMLGSRSGNRGLCAQPCRLDFRADGQDYALSLKDLSLVKRIQELRALGVSSLKIEGRMKRPEYVAASISACRAALRGETPELERLEAVFSRSGFTEGYYTGQRRNMRGIRRKEDVTAAADVLPELKQLAAKPVKRMTVDMKLILRPEKPTELFVRSMVEQATYYYDVPQTARTRETTAEEAVRQLSKLGDTCFEPGEVIADIAPGLYLPLSALNELRRCMIQNLYAAYEGRNTRLGRVTDEKWRTDKPDASVTPIQTLRVECRTWEQWLAVRAFGAEGCLPIDVLLAHPNDIGEKPFVMLPRWMAGREAQVTESLKTLRERGYTRLICQNIAHVGLANALGFTPHGGWGLNVTNSRSLRALSELGLADCVLSVELTLQKRPAGFMPLGRVLYGRQPLMMLARCPVRDDAPRVGCTRCQPLTDRTGRTLPLRCDGHSVEVLNADTLWMADKLPDIRADFGVLLLHEETPEEVAALLEAYTRGAPPPESGFTRGLYYRGVE